MKNSYYFCVMLPVVFVVSFLYGMDEQFVSDFQGPQDITPLPFQSSLFQIDGRPTQPLRNVLEKLNIQADRAESINKAIQERFFTGREFHLLCPTSDQKSREKEWYECEKILGTWEERKPQKANPEGAILLGANYFEWLAVRTAYYLKQATDNGKKRYQSLYVCAGTHAMHPFDEKELDVSMQLLPQRKEDKYKTLHGYVDTEYHRSGASKQLEYSIMVKLCACLYMPNFPQWIPSELNLETGARPNTQSNAISFLEANPKDGHYDLFTHQPHTEYQKDVFDTEVLLYNIKQLDNEPSYKSKYSGNTIGAPHPLVPTYNQKAITFEAIGPAADAGGLDKDTLPGGLNIVRAQDRFARRVYQAWLYLKTYRKYMEALRAAQSKEL